MCTWHYPLRKPASKPRMIASLLAWMYGATQRRSLWPFEARPCCSSLHFKMVKTKNTSTSSQTTNFAIQFSPPCACEYRASLKSMSRKLLLQSLAKHNQTMYSPLSSSKRNLARSQIPPMKQWNKTWVACRLFAGQRTSRDGAFGQAQALAFLQYAC